MGARFPYYLLSDSPEGQIKEAEITRSSPSTTETFRKLSHGFVYERVPHITLKSIANNAEIDEIWEDFQTRLEPLRSKLNKALKQKWKEWEIPRQSRGIMECQRKKAPCRMVGTTHRPTKRNRCFHRRKGRLRISLRQTLRRQIQSPGRGTIHRRIHFAPPGPPQR